MFLLVDLKNSLILFNGNRDKKNNNRWLNKFNAYLKKNLKKLTFGESFNQDVSNLPRNLKKIKFGCRFNKRLINLPENLDTLILEEDYQFKDEIEKNYPRIFYFY